MFQSISTSWGRIKFRFQGSVLGRLGVEAFHAALRRHQPGFHWSLATGPASMADGPQLYGNFSRVTDDKLSRFLGVHQVQSNHMNPEQGSWKMVVLLEVAIVNCLIQCFLWLLTMSDEPSLQIYTQKIAKSHKFD